MDDCYSSNNSESDYDHPNPYSSPPSTPSSHHSGFFLPLDHSPMKSFSDHQHQHEYQGDEASPKKAKQMAKDKPLPQLTTVVIPQGSPSLEANSVDIQNAESSEVIQDDEDILAGAFLMSHLRPHCENCYTMVTPQWRKGWSHPLLGKYVLLCNACGLRYAKSQYCPYCYYVYGKETDRDPSIWLNCSTCGRWTHVECEQANGKHKVSKSNKWQQYTCITCEQKNGSSTSTPSIPNNYSTTSISTSTREKKRSREVPHPASFPSSPYSSSSEYSHYENNNYHNNSHYHNNNSHSISNLTIDHDSQKNNNNNNRQSPKTSKSPSIGSLLSSPISPIATTSPSTIHSIDYYNHNTTTNSSSHYLYPPINTTSNNTIFVFEPPKPTLSSTNGNNNNNNNNNWTIASTQPFVFPLEYSSFAIHNNNNNNSNSNNGNKQLEPLNILLPKPLNAIQTD